MDLERFLEPVPGDQPSGLELRNDPRFAAIERALEPAALRNRKNEDGSINPLAPPPDWQEVVSTGAELAAMGRDLRLLVMMVRAAYAEDGFQGLASGLTMLAQTLERYWDGLHPELRDRPDPSMAVRPRLNALKQLENDDNGLLGDLRFGMVLNPRGLGPIIGDDLARAMLSDFEVMQSAASGLSQREKDEVLARHKQVAARVKGASRAMADTEAERLTEMTAGISACEAAVGSLEAAFATQSGLTDTGSLTLPELKTFLERCRATLAAAQAEGGGATTSAPTDGAPETAPVPGAAPAAPAGPSGPGVIASREDVEKSLDAIVAFYERTEPGSPIPHLAKRLRSLVRLDFLDLMEQVAPGGLKEFRALAGIEEPTRRSRRGNDE
ncbi:type VI secretion system protein TssA [Jannaschia seohaensis]|uniref:Type VI secretion system protein ImpA n=1 Tax=Jannaschia seohaensis TaxID=475081 RepID=A0A2Y9AX43_9RHOB|nr:type VI secretion system protein TssA [Jannaschia seohaensis]PWJ16563.1 type VI secretion system protein ImpA [Jannaschia seohaensis]SSA48800.1 type VI secretion system protein ImpA [Jannaschia seohaensis]